MKDWAIAKLQTLHNAKKLPHAWLFVGADTKAILKIAEEFSQWLLCVNRQGNLACGTCKTCNLFLAHTHPDFCIITPQIDKKTILIDDMRILAEFTAAKPQFSQNKIVLIYPAEAMHIQSANSLLKSLEEPHGNTIFLLLSKHSDLLLKTIISRCQILHFSSEPRDHKDSKDIIQRMVDDLSNIYIAKTLTPTQIVEGWIKQWPHEVLYWFELVLTDLIRFKYTQDTRLLKNCCPEHMILSQAISVVKLWNIYERLVQARYWLGMKQNPNMQLLLEDILLVMNR